MVTLNLTHTSRDVGHSRFRRAFRHDDRPRPLRDRQVHHSSDRRHLAPLVGHLPLLLRHAGGSLPHDVPATGLPDRPHARRYRLRVGAGVPVDGDRHKPRGPVRTALLPRLRRVRDPDGLHVHHQRILHAVGAVAAPELVVQQHRVVDNHRRRAELRLRADHRRGPAAVAVHLPVGRVAYVPVWAVLLRCAQQSRQCVVPDQGGEVRGRGEIEIWADWCTLHQVQVEPAT